MSSKCKYTVVRDENLKTTMDEISNKVKFINTVHGEKSNEFDSKDYVQIILNRKQFMEDCNNLIHVKHWTYNRCTDNVRMIAVVNNDE